jgi:tetratricopeptide (TPR) repeat protein
MLLPLHGARRWLFPIILVPLLGMQLILAGRELVASIFGQRADPISLARAIRLSPRNAEYQNRLGRYFAFGVSNPGTSLDPLRSAVRLNPHHARYWLDLAAAYQFLGNSDEQSDAVERALEVEPTSPDVAWESANLFLSHRDLDRALREFRVVIENAPELRAEALASCWRVRPDVDVLLRDVVPARPDSLLTFLTLLTNKHETDGSLQVWNRLLELHQRFDTNYLLDYVRYLILARRPDAALSAWEESAALLGLSDYLPSPDNLIVNGDFSLDVLNGGLDWTYKKQTGVQLVLDPSDFHRGQRSLSVTFEGPGIYDAGIHQFVPVHGWTAYDFTAYYKSADFQGAGGPQIVLRDAYTGQALFTSDPIIDGDFWKAVHGEFTTPASTSLLIVNIERTPAGSPIRGKLWLDNFQLLPAQPKDESKDHS